MNTLVVVAHPSLDETSIANRIIVDRIRSLSQVTIKNLHQDYPSFTFKVDTEQDALRKADSVVFQFPFYWYSVPGILKEWMDQVLTYGFAYGSTGDKLKGKHFLVSTTVGGPVDAYCESGYNNYTIGDLLKPLRQMSNLTGMVYHRPIVSHGMIFIPNVYNTREEVEGRAREHAEKLHRYITAEKTEAMPSNQLLDF
ncbi:MAG: NAD(P)H-dependent oxidoreductase [Candidatus Lindowbacteria bacterium]|nr:NAD(P)H-dependent oxidoreductase [Candidatus Lindowbacteria bacterium]